MGKVLSLPDGFVMPELVPGKLPCDVTVVVAMSGGVDSSTVAAMCAAAGYNTVGVTLQLWDYSPESNPGKPKEFGTCCALDDVYDARRVCAALGIPHYVLNMESAFKEAVVDDFVATYLAGATPIPCVRCNQRIKFKELMAKTKALGADVLATGHYVQKAMVGGKAVLKAAADLKKDQTYYLFATLQEEIERLVFPLGAMTKPDVRALAAHFGLHVSGKKDSFDICFVPGGDYRAVVKRFAPEADKPGDICLEDGTVVGRHDGIVGFTVGQRKGVPGGFPVPMYVVRVDAEASRVVIGPRASLGRRIFTVKDLNWLGDSVDDMRVRVKVRAQHGGAEGVVRFLEGGWAEVVLDMPEDQVAPGQAAVFYTEEGVMLGGGWITGLRD